MAINLDLHIFRSPTFESVLSEAYTFFTTTPIQPLPEERFFGAGLYALYYTGTYEPYAKIAALNHGACV